jgi:proline iminopeptidase
LTNLSAFIPVALLFCLTACTSGDSAPAVNDGYLKGAEDAKIYYRMMGTGQDTVVVVHGGPGAGMNSVIPAFKPLAENFVLIFYDQRGGGRSELPADTTKLKPEYFVEDLEAVRSHFGLGQMNVISHSFGSVLVAQYAMKYPDHLSRMVFHGATGPDLMQELEIRRAKAKLTPPSPDTALSNRASELLQSLLNGTASDPLDTCREYEEISRKLAVARGDSVTWKGTTCEAPPEAVWYYYRYTAQLAPRYYRGWDFTRKLENVTAPLLVVHGKRDSLMIPAQQAWADAVPNGELLLVPDAEKGAISGNTEFVLPAIRKFFRGS